jgi:glycerol-3-phosphate O-acyltransferase
VGPGVEGRACPALVDAETASRALQWVVPSLEATELIRWARWLFRRADSGAAFAWGRVMTTIGVEWSSSDATHGPERPLEPPDVVSGDRIGGQVLHRVVERVFSSAKLPRGPRLDEVVYETVYAEQTRLDRAESDPRTEADRAFVGWLRREMARAGEDRYRELVRAIVARYVDEISGHFNPLVYRMATRVVPPALSVLFHGLSLRSPRAFDIEDRIVIEGEVDALRALSRRGTIVLAPTHVSNLDSLVLGSAINQLRLPPFAYGAGLNLFSNALIGFFMRHLGAYTVDRKKTDPLYRATLKEYTTVLLQNGQHSLFFPGGTRSRSGAIETRLKLGMLGTAPIAFRHSLESGAPYPRIFVVPCTLTYPLVLEASTLIGEYLRAEGGPHYVDVHDEFDRPRRWLEFLGGLRQLDLRVHFRIARPLDWLGNEVDDEGTSHDQRGRSVDVSRYLTVGGSLTQDDARDAAYTRLLAPSLVAAYRRESVALPTTLVAFVLFERLRRERREPSLFRFMRGLGPERGVPTADFFVDLARARDELLRLERQNLIRCSDDVRYVDAPRILEHALATFATYHVAPVVERLGDRLVVGDPGLLLYYQNRLTGYGLPERRPS